MMWCLLTKIKWKLEACKRKKGFGVEEGKFDGKRVWSCDWRGRGHRKRILAGLNVWRACRETSMVVTELKHSPGWHLNPSIFPPDQLQRNGGSCKCHTHIHKHTSECHVTMALCIQRWRARCGKLNSSMWPEPGTKGSSVNGVVGGVFLSFFVSVPVQHGKRLLKKTRNLPWWTRLCLFFVLTVWKVHITHTSPDFPSFPIKLILLMNYDKSDLWWQTC